MKSLFRAALPLLVSISAFAAPCGKWGLNPNTGRFDCVGTGGSGTGTVTSVSFTGGIISVANPTTTPAFTVAATSGGVVYGVDATHWGFSGAMASGQFMLGGGAGSPPTTSFSVVPVASGGTSFSSYTKGDTICPSAATTFTKLAVGSDGQVLTADAASTCGIKWSTVSGTGNVTTSVTLTANRPVLGNGTNDIIVGTFGSGITLSGTAITVDTAVIMPLAGTSTITGVKTFSAGPIITEGSASATLNKITISSTSHGLNTGDSSNPMAYYWTTSTACTASQAIIGSSTASGTGCRTIDGAGSLYGAGGALGTIGSGTATNLTGLPISTGVDGLGTGIATFLGTPSSANLAAAVTNETGTGLLVFATGPTFVTPVLGAATGTSLVLSGSLTSNALTSGRVSFAGTSGILQDDSDLTFATDTLTFTKGAATTSLTVAGAAVTNNIVQNSQSTAYTTVLGDAGKQILHPTADNNARTLTIDSNANVAYPIGTCITFVNQINTVTIAITSDTLTLAGAGTAGSRTLAASGWATACKVGTTAWFISGSGLT